MFHICADFIKETFLLMISAVEVFADYLRFFYFSASDMQIFALSTYIPSNMNEGKMIDLY